MKKMYRSSNRILAGVCGGIAEYLDIDPTVVRVLYFVLSFFSAAFPGLLLYLCLTLLIPNQMQA
jgi:phage shock protein C